MSKGFVTIATGDERYYRMARTLLRSYRQTSKTPGRFALIADRENEYTAEFDDVVILENPENSWMDKLRLLDSCPYDENIFIDADCLIYQDVNFFWDLFAQADDFSCFGKVLPMDSKDGWFTAEAAQVYPIRFITHLHGICYFLRKGAALEKMAGQCRTIIENYDMVRYKGFNDRLADEPVFALAMAVLDLKPIERKPEYYCFVPFATKFQSNYFTKEVSFENPKDGKVERCCIVHWGNLNTKKARYLADASVVDAQEKDEKGSLRQHLLYEKQWLLCHYQMKDAAKAGKEKMTWFFGRVWAKLTGKG